MQIVSKYSKPISKCLKIVVNSYTQGMTPDLAPEEVVSCLAGMTGWSQHATIPVHNEYAFESKWYEEHTVGQKLRLGMFSRNNIRLGLRLVTQAEQRRPPNGNLLCFISHGNLFNSRQEFLG